MKRYDLKLIVVIVIIALGMFCARQFVLQKDGGVAIVYVNGEEYGSYSLQKKQLVKVGTTNQFFIEDQHVKMIEGNCPDKLCVQQKSIWRNGETIVCLPNKVVIEVRGNKEKSELDGIVN